MTVARDVVEEIFEANVEVEKKDEKFNNIVEILDKHFSPQVNKDSQTFIFRQSSQRQGEIIGAYCVVHLLRLLFH